MEIIFGNKRDSSQYFSKNTDIVKKCDIDIVKYNYKISQIMMYPSQKKVGVCSRADLMNQQKSCIFKNGNFFLANLTKGVKNNPNKDIKKIEGWYSVIKRQEGQIS